MILIKKLLLTVALFTVGLQLKAETAKIEILLTNGIYDEVTLDRHYVMLFDEGNLVIHGKDIMLSWPISNVVSISFNDIQTSNIATVTAQSPRYIITKDSICYDFGDNGGTISLYNMNGDLINQADCSFGKCTLQFDGLVNGIYIVKAKDEVIKILVRK